MRFIALSLFTALFLPFSLAVAASPAPLPDRWLLKLLPADLPQLPDRLYTATWFEQQHNRSSSIGKMSWQLWVEFRKGSTDQPAGAVVTLIGEKTFLAPVPPFAPGHRSVSLAVYGPLIEVDGILFTSRVMPGKPGGRPDMLLLGSAIELKNRVWYQAGTKMNRNGQRTVVEWRFEFKDDPRTTAEGMVDVHGNTRIVAEPDSQSLDKTMKFKAETASSPSKSRVVTLLPTDDTKLPHPLPTLVLDDEHSGSASYIRLEDLDQILLYSPAANAVKSTLVEAPTVRAPGPAKP